MLYSLLLPVHITGGILGILSGTAAVVYRKGSSRHALAGKIFVAAMLVMSGAAVYLAVLKHQPNNIGGGILTFYLILTAWFTAKRQDGETSRFDWIVLLIPTALGVLTLAQGFGAVRRGAGMLDGNVPVFMAFFMGSIMLLAAAGDVHMILNHGVLGAKRIRRHLWRMCFGLFIAAGSFFLGQQQVFPAFLRGSLLLTILGVLPLFLLIFWLIRVRFVKTYRTWGEHQAQGAD